MKYKSHLTFGKRLRKARKEANMTQDDLAGAISNMIDQKRISRTCVTQWESGNSVGIEGSSLIKVAKILNVTPEWLIFGILRI